MTEREAIKQFKERIDISDYKEQIPEYYEAMEMAINALEKQIPKKITHPGCYDNEGIWHTWNGINGVPYDLCPNCKINLCTGGVFGRDKNKMKYCKNCGQKLDWSDEE